MTYAAEVSADNPLGWWRLDRVGAATNGEEVEDSSGNDLHGSLVYAAGIDSFQPWGYASAIETDPGSYAIHTRTVQMNASFEVFGYAKTYVEVPDDSALDLNDFALEIWFRQADYRYYGQLSNSTYTILSKGGAYGLSVRVEQLPAAGVAFLEPVLQVFLADGQYKEVQAAGYRFTPGVWYHIVGRRVGPSISIDVNGRLINSETIPGTATRTTSNPLIIGSIQTALAGAILDEPAVYSALSTARGLVHYEAAKASLPVTWECVTSFPFEIDTGAPTPVPFAFLHNFAKPIGGQAVPLREFLSYSTGVAKADADYEQRNDKQPLNVERTFEAHITPVGARSKQIFDATLWAPGSFYVKPVEISMTFLTAEAAGGSTTLECDTTFREFAAGGWLVACPDPYDPTSYQWFRADTVADDEIETLEEVSDDLPEGCAVFACRLSLIADAPDLESLTANRIDATIQFDVLSTERPTRHITPYTPAVTHKSLEIYDQTVVRVPWLGDGGKLQAFRRVGVTGNSFGNDYSRGVDTGTPRTVPVRFTIEGREDLAAFRGWLDYHRGKQTPLWVSSEEDDLSFVSKPSASKIRVTGDTYSSSYALHHGRRDLRLLYTDGTVSYNRVTAFETNVAGTEDLTLSPGPTALKTIQQISYLSQARLTSGEVELIHHRNGTDFLTEARVSFVELLSSPA